MEAEGGPVVCISCGDPAGIGPEITAKLAHKDFNARIVAVADCEVIGQAADYASSALKLHRINDCLLYTSDAADD